MRQISLHGRNEPVIDDLYRAEPLRASQAEQVYPLVSLLHPGVTPEEWRQFVRRATRMDRHRGGLMAIRDRRGYCHAVFSYRVGDILASGRSLRVSDVVMGRLPGVNLPQALVTCAERLAAELDSAAISIDLEESMVSPRDREALQRAGFDASGLILTRGGEPCP
jgi:hypothetical protein